MPDLLYHVRALAEEIGPRSATSVGEARAARYIVEAAKGMTHQVWTEPFHSFSSPIWAWLLVLGLAVAGAGALWWLPELSAAVSLVASICFVAQANGWIELGWLFRQRESQNVVAVLTSKEMVRERVVLVAHYDTARGRSRSTMFPYFWLSTACMFTLPLVAVLSWVTAKPVWLWASLLPAALLLGVAGAVAVRELLAQPGPGAVDNGSGVAAALQTGERVAAAPLAHTEVWLVFTGCKEVGLVGMQSFLDRHERLLSNAHFVVLDCIGSGRVRYSPRERPGKDGAHTNQVAALANEATVAHPEWGISAAGPRPGLTDASAALRRGLSAIAVTAQELGCCTEQVDPVCLDIAVRFVLDLARRVDRLASEEGIEES